jgi:glycerol-3-phosphate acyltransferase PlsY
MIPDLLAPDRAMPFLIAALLGGYIVGASPFGLWLTKIAGLGDIRKIGSGGIGATNVLRTGRRWIALATLILDVLKGFVPAYIGYNYFGPLVGAAAGLGALCGHCYSFYLNFYGGKGVATGVGVLLALLWQAAVIAAAVWLAVALISRRSSVGSLSATLAGVASLPYCEAWDVLPAALVMAAIIFGRHQANIGRLLRGEEPKISLKRPNASRGSDP